MAQALPLVTMTVNRQGWQQVTAGLDHRKCLYDILCFTSPFGWELPLDTGHYCGNPKHSDNSCGLCFQISISSYTHFFFCYRHSRFGFLLGKLFVICLSNILDTYSIRKQSQLLWINEGGGGSWHFLLEILNCFICTNSIFSPPWQRGV